MEASMSKAEQTKSRILDAALAEFAAHGIAGARVDRIAAAAACNKNLLYVYFGNKEKLFGAVLETHLSRLHEEIPFTPDDLSDFGGRVFDWAMSHTDLMRLVVWSTLERPNHSSDGRAASHDDKIAELVQAQAEHHPLPPLSPTFLVTTVMAVATAWSPALPFGTAMHPDQPQSLSDLRDQVVAAIRRLTTAA